MTCKDCIYYSVCYYHDFEECERFKDKARMIELKLKVGDKVFIPRHDGTIEESEVTRVDVTYKMNEQIKNSVGTWWLTEHNIGVTSFLTKEEAEKALKELKERE